MSESTPVPKKKITADWLVKGVLTKIGDTVDRFTGRRWTPSSSLAASELTDRIKKLLDAEAKKIPGRGTVVPHNIKLKMQWDKFSDDAEESIRKLEVELMTAAADHINNSLYYTYAPLTVEVKVDYFTEGVILFAGFDKFDEDEREVELNVTVPSIKVGDIVSQLDNKPLAVIEKYIARYAIKGVPKEKELEFIDGQRLSVGRTGENALQIDDVSVSKIHASLVVGVDRNLSVADTGSTNGTFVNDERIAYGKATCLESTDSVRFGLIPISFEYIPRAEVPEPEIATEVELIETVEIDGFEFKKRIGPENSTETSPAIPVPDKSLNFDRSEVIEEIPVPDNLSTPAIEKPLVSLPSVSVAKDPVRITSPTGTRSDEEKHVSANVAEQPVDIFKTKG